MGLSRAVLMVARWVDLSDGHWAASMETTRAERMACQKAATRVLHWAERTATRKAGHSESRWVETTGFQKAVLKAPLTAGYSVGRRAA